jgi:hypothetical protein
MPSLRTLAPGFRETAQAFFQAARDDYPDAGLTITSAFRTHAEQDVLYRRFLAGDNNGLPALPPGDSDHERGLAFDMARINVDPLHDPLLAVLGKAWIAAGGKWWSGDPVHFSSGSGWGARGPRSKRTRHRRASRRNR